MSDWQMLDEYVNFHGASPAVLAAIARLREREAHWEATARQESDWQAEWQARAEAAEARVAEAEAIIHSALVTSSDPTKALREVMDALGGESIPVALAHEEETSGT